MASAIRTEEAVESRISGQGSTIDRMLDWVEHRPWLGLAIISFCYWSTVLAFAWWRPTWFDEFFSLKLSQQTLSELWRSMMTGGETHPVSFYWITHASMMIFGKTLFALRMPSMLAQWVMMLALYSVVARRTSPVYGYVAALFPLLTYSSWYATEGRGYELGTGACAVALWCWDEAAHGCRRQMAIVGLALSLALAVGSHYYMFLFLIPLGIGELLRTVRLRRIDWPIWLAFSAFVTPVLAFWPTIRATRKYFNTYNFEVTLGDIPLYVHDVFGDQFLGLLVLLATVFLFTAVPTDWRPERRMLNYADPRFYERILAMSIVGMEVYVLLMCKFVTHAYQSRYAITGVIGIGILAAMVPAQLTRKRLPAAVLAVLLLLSFTALEAHRVRRAIQQHAAFRTMPAYFTRFPALPIVMAHPDEWLRWHHYIPALRDRMVFLLDKGRAVKHLKTDVVERALTDLSMVVPAGVVPYDRYVASHDRFLVYRARDEKWTSWAEEELVKSGYTLQTLDEDQKGNKVFLAERSHP